MVCSSTANTGTTSTHTVNDILIRYIYINCIIHLLSKLCKCFIKCFCLRNGSRKSIQNISILAVFLIHTVNYEINYQFIRYKKSLIHICFCFFTKLCSLFDISSEDISSRNVWDFVLSCNFLSLCAFSSSWRTRASTKP